jgi:5'-nucleotidase
MAYPIERKLVIAVASSALFDLEESDKIFREGGEDAYREFQRDNVNVTLRRGVAFPFIRRFLNINKAYPDKQPVEVVLLSRNDPDTGLRVMHSIKSYGLDITRAAFLTGKSPYQYIPAFNVSLFLSANQADVYSAIDAKHPAGIVLPSLAQDDVKDPELRVAFDFDGVLADDEAETVYKEGSLDLFAAHETSKANIPHRPGPLSDLFKKLSFFQRLERRRSLREPEYRPILRIAIVTARNAPSHERVVTTLQQWGVSPDETFFLGGIEKRRVLEILKPHMFFDDQMTHIEAVAGNIPSVHVPFGIRNANQSRDSQVPLLLSQTSTSSNP